MKRKLKDQSHSISEAEAAMKNRAPNFNQAQREKESPQCCGWELGCPHNARTLKCSPFIKGETT